ncbi:MAG: adenylate/guanylate cyclase domain-containing protein [Deltaproteobacteria bacterium]|nr:adenylate/guanylate cyclase domain-containing protein [Deltaproteobacteria bacterium]
MLRSTFWRQLWVALMVGLMAGAGGAGVAYFRWAERPEHYCYDRLLLAAQQYLPKPESEPVVMVAIDDASIDQVRRDLFYPWPWPRSLVGLAVQELETLGAKVIVLDQLFFDYTVHGTKDEVEFVDFLHHTNNVVVAAQTAELSPMPSVGSGSWAVRLAAFKTRAEAMDFAIEPLAHQYQVYLVPGSGGTTGVWLGGFGSRTKLEDRLSGMVSLGDVKIVGEPEIRELTAEELTHALDADAWVPARDKLDVPGLSSLQIPGDEGWLLPRPEIAATARVGFANDTVRTVGGERGEFEEVANDDGDLPLSGSERQVRLFVRRGKDIYPSLSLAALLATNPGPLSIRDGRLHYGDKSVPINRRGFMNIAYPSSMAAFDAALPGSNRVIHIHFSNVVRNAQRREHQQSTDANLAAAVKGKVVVVGNLASDLYDVKVTPVEGMNSGSAVVASSLRTLLLGDAVARATREQDARWAFAMGLLGALYALIVFRYARSSGFIVVSALGVMAGAALYASYALHTFVDARVWLAVFTPGAAFGAAAVGTGWINFGEADTDRERVALALGRFTSPAIVESVLRNPLLIAPKRRELTILFSDIAGFTTISESMPAPRLAELLAIYFTEVTAPIAQTQGHVDKFIGDAVMAFWNAPLPNERHAALACKAALAMRERLDKIRAALKKDFGVEVTARVGLNSGEVVVGEMGARGKEGEQKSNYTCLGDAVNLASRLEGVNKMYGTTILCGPRTQELAGEGFVFREIDRVRVKGKTEAVTVYELVSAKGDKLEAGLKDALTRYAQGLAAYRERNFAAAQTHFEAALAAKKDDAPSAIFRDRCKDYLASPPPADWDGANTLHDK